MGVIKWVSKEASPDGFRLLWAHSLLCIHMPKHAVSDPACPQDSWPLARGPSRIAAHLASDGRTNQSKASEDD